MLGVLAQATGLRHSELLGLRWNLIDLDARTLTVTSSSGDGQLKDLKTAAGKRALPLPASVVELLRHHQAEQGVHERVAQQFAGHADTA